MNVLHAKHLQEWLARFFTLKNNSLPVGRLDRAPLSAEPEP